jgi:23S rRNA (uracil1939-C5)-methyltransferase
MFARIPVADQFAQASADGNVALRGLVREAAGSLDGRRVLELHAGSGNFTRDLAAAGGEVVAVEASPSASALARRTLADRGLAERERLVAAPVAEALRDAVRPDLVLLDPPRSGLAVDETEALVALAAPRLIYVSCDPETLARDLGRLAAGGYQVRWAAPLDLMPQTFHVETVVLVERGTPSAG